MRTNAQLFFTAATLIVCGTPVVYAFSNAAKLNCGASTAAKHIHLTQPETPPQECNYRINAYNNNICQLRIDFSLTLAQPSIPDAQNGLWYVQCMKDYFAVNGLKLCGTEVGQHIYVPFNRTAGVESIDLSIVTAPRSGDGKLAAPRWNMHIRQLEYPSKSALRGTIDSLEVEENDNEHLESDIGPRASVADNYLLAPPGCLQYFPEAVGTITSFNYNGGSGVYPANLNYAICFRRQQSSKSLEIKMRYFRLGAEYSRQKFHELDNYCRPQLRSEGLSEDYLLIPQATVVESNIRATYFCGSSIQGDTVASTNPGPLVLIFNSDGNYKAGQEVGYALSYKVV
ncbi:uncharacterized protein LOC120772670 [Bactrocera tryoni]|uniref:uncharacterized protein LOC120772670 n=1 Tax=Bactrocera tryoni TaxID=59916 RepID=UPI001A97A16B|nr:uncharacterized protein LOC120772670 [Bactrocera tryoni]